MRVRFFMARTLLLSVGLAISSALVALPLGAASLPGLAKPPIDYAREDRWTQEVVPSLVVGEAVYLATAERGKVLAILTQPSHRAKGAVLIVHGLGVHPDFGVINAL